MNPLYDKVTRMRENNGSWGVALIWFVGACLFWVIAYATPIGRAILDALLAVNSVGV